MNPYFRNKIFFPLIGILMLIFFAPRIALIEADPPAFESYQYQPLDEGYYSILSLNLKKLGEPVNHSANPKIESVTSNYNVFGNLVTFLSLSIFGENYYGFRFGNLIFSMFGFLIFMLILKALAVEYSKNTNSTDVNQADFYPLFVFILVSLIFCLTPASIFSSIYIEPTSTRMSCLLFYIFIVFKTLERNSHSDRSFYYWIYLTVFSTLLYVLIYPTNVFLIFSTLFLFLLSSYNFEKKLTIPIFKKITLTTSAMLLSSLITYWLCSSILRGVFGHQADSKNILSVIISERIFGASSFEKLFSIFSTSFLNDNLGLALFIPLFALNYRSKPLFFGQRASWLSGIFLCLLAQCVFLNDYAIRKSIIFMPFILLFLFMELLVFKYKKDFSLHHFVLFLIGLFSIFMSSMYRNKAFLDLDWPHLFILILFTLLGVSFFLFRNTTYRRLSVIAVSFLLIFLVLYMPAKKTLSLLNNKTSEMKKMSCCNSRNNS